MSIFDYKYKKTQKHPCKKATSLRFKPNKSKQTSFAFLNGKSVGLFINSTALYGCRVETLGPYSPTYIDFI